MKTKILLFSFWLAAALTLATRESGAEMAPVKKIRAGVPPFEVIEEIMTGNREAAVGPAPTPSGTRAVPHMTWLADCDARLQPELVHTAALDKVYTVRNPGNQLALSLGAVDYGVRALFTPVLLITGNTDSDAIRFAMAGLDRVEPSLRQDLERLHLSPAAAGEEGEAEMSFEERWLRNIEKNVDLQVDQALARYGDRVKGGRLVVIGAVIDLSNQYGHGEKKLVIINVNGETEAGRMQENRLLVRLDRTMLHYVGRGKAGPQPPEAGTTKAGAPEGPPEK